MRVFRIAVFALLFVTIVPSFEGQSSPASQHSPSSQQSALIEHLVYANRILYDQGVIDGFGHVSARDEKNPQHFLMSRSMAPGLVTTKDILEYDVDGAPVDAAGRAVYLERFIHAAIYRARPDVKAILRAHSPSFIPFGEPAPTFGPATT